MARPQLYQNSWITVPWAEFVGKDGSHGAQFNSGWTDDSRAIFNILVYWTDVLQAEQDILGIAIFDPATNRLSRTPPVAHPLKPQMRAEKIISAHPLAWNGKALVDFPYAWGNGGPTGALSSYVYFLLSIGFSVPKYAIVTDTDLQTFFGGLEFNRWCEVEEDPQIETITREAGAFVWSTGSPANLLGQPFSAPLAQNINAESLKVIWRRVPRVGLFTDAGTGYLLNNNIKSSLGFVHNGDTPMWGIGSAFGNANSNGSPLRLVSAKQRPISSPLWPLNQGIPWWAMNTYHDVEFTFRMWDPPSGDGVNFGHNLAPNPAFDGNWYLVKTLSGATIYPVGNLSIIFQLTTGGWTATP